MKIIFSKIDKLSIVLLIVLLVGILSSFLDFGILSVFFSVTLPLIFIGNCMLAIYGIFKKKYISFIGVLIFLFLYNFFFQFNVVEDKASKDSISVLTYNIREFRQPISANFERTASTEIIKFVDSLKADILVFQESSYKDVIHLKGYPYVFLGYRDGIDKSLLTIHSKYPIVNKGYIDFPDTRNNAIYADIKIQSDTIRIYNSHLQSFVFNPSIIADKYNDYNYLTHLNNTTAKQIEQAKQIKRNANKSKRKVIICGDFNATPYSLTYRILKRGLNDSYVSKGNGFGRTYSNLKYPLRLDYFLNDKSIDVISHDNFSLKFSDHEPILIKFKIK